MQHRCIQAGPLAGCAHGAATASTIPWLNAKEVEGGVRSGLLIPFTLSLLKTVGGCTRFPAPLAQSANR